MSATGRSWGGLEIAVDNVGTSLAHGYVPASVQRHTDVVARVPWDERGTCFSYVPRSFRSSAKGKTTEVSFRRG